MARQVAKLIGGAGTGKTTELLRIMGEIVASGVEPMDIGYVSFTRAARAEAAQRVVDQFGGDAADLQSAGWFRTLHSVCYRCLGGRFGDRLLAGGKDDAQWLAEALGESSIGYEPTESLEDRREVLGADAEGSSAAKALQLWDLARSRLESLHETYLLARKMGGTLPPYARVRSCVDRYERAKWNDDRLDYCDLAGRFAGWVWDLDGEPRGGTPQGYTPEVPVWFFDEHQDVSRLLDSVACRLAEAPGVRWVYYAGDPFQSIYGFGGSDYRCLLDVPCDRYRVMDQSYRCPRIILQRGEEVLRKTTDYFNRFIKPRDEVGRYAKIHCIKGTGAEQYLRASEGSWLLLARTNYTARRLSAYLDRNGIPWDYTRGNGGYVTPTHRMVSGLLYDLSIGKTISSAEWESLIRYLPAGRGVNSLLERGVKTAAVAGTYRTAIPRVSLASITDAGGTETLQSIVSTGRWVEHVEGAPRYLAAVKHAYWGRAYADQPTIRVGTIHSVKGSEADNVLLLDEIGPRIVEAIQCPEGRDAELRVSYVGITRARKRLFVLSPREAKHHLDTGPGSLRDH